LRTEIVNGMDDYCLCLGIQPYLYKAKLLFSNHQLFEIETMNIDRFIHNDDN